MNEQTFQDIWAECLGFNIEQKPEEYKHLLSLLNARGTKRYALEIGSNYGGTTAGFCRLFDTVITIDIKHHENFDRLKEKYPTYQYIISDSKSNDTVEYIKSLGIKFDFIFIDGDHSYEGAKNDYDKYKQFLSQDGYIGFHDIISSDLNRQYNINVDILWNEIKNTYNGVHEFVAKSKHTDYSRQNEFHKIVEKSDYSQWGGIGILENTPIGVFSHNYLSNNWYDIVNNQLSKLVNSGLYKRADKIVYGVNTDADELYYRFIELLNKYDSDRKIEIYRYTKNMYEFSTLIHLQNYCANNPNASVLYYHAKGTSRKYDRNIESWRECLEYFNIEQWRRCHAEVKNERHDVCGALYIEKFAFLNIVLTNYYSGNFWWANAKYINRLDNLTAKIIEVNMERAEAERWIGRKPHRWASLYNEDVSAWYEHYFDPKLYKQS